MFVRHKICPHFHGKPLSRSIGLIGKIKTKKTKKHIKKIYLSILLFGLLTLACLEMLKNFLFCVSLFSFHIIHYVMPMSHTRHPRASILQRF